MMRDRAATAETADLDKTVPGEQFKLPQQKLKTLRAAALAGILFTLLYSSSIVLIRLSTPAKPEDGGMWLEAE